MRSQLEEMYQRNLQPKVFNEAPEQRSGVWIDDYLPETSQAERDAAAAFFNDMHERGYDPATILIASKKSRSPRENTWVRVILALACFFLGFSAHYAFGRDMTGLSAQLTPQQNDWVRDLSSPGGGRCCDDADGFDPVWRAWSTSPSGYQIQVEGTWQDVPKDRLITKSNKIGVARVWLYHEDGLVYVRCFLPGSGT